MDIVYHGHCMDGAFSAFSMFVFLNLLKYKYKEEYKNTVSRLLRNLVEKKPILL